MESVSFCTCSILMLYSVNTMDLLTNKDSFLLGMVVMEDLVALEDKVGLEDKVALEEEVTEDMVGDLVCQLKMSP